MQVLLSSVGTRGDVQPVLALALALRARDHDVRLCISPNFVAWARALDLPARPLGIEMRQPRPGAPPISDDVRQIAADLIKNQFDVVGAAAEGCDVIVGGGLHQYAARSIAEARRIPFFVAAYAPVSFPSSDHAPPSWNERSLERVNQNRAGLGLAPVDDVLRHILGDRPWLAADPTLGPAPSGSAMHVVQTGAWILPDASPLPPALEAFLRAGAPPVALGFGSMPAAPHTSGTLIAAARAAGRRAILSAGWAELALVDDGDDCLSIGDVNQQALFPRVAAVVHHGGAGTTTAAALAGVPQVVVPMFSDQFYWASRVESLGLGTSVTAETLTSESLAAALGRAFGAVERARVIAEQIVTDGAARAAQHLETALR